MLPIFYGILAYSGDPRMRISRVRLICIGIKNLFVKSFYDYL